MDSPASDDRLIRRAIRFAVLLGVALVGGMRCICLPARAGQAAETPFTFSDQGSAAGGPAIGQATACDAKPLGVVTVAILANTPIVTISANGRPVTLLLDTGAERTVLTPDTARRIGAQSAQVQFSRRIHGLSGSLATYEVELSQFAAGGTPIPWRRVEVAPVTLSRPLLLPLDGLLGADVLSNFDLDIDLPHQRMTLYEKRSCVGGPPWNGRYSAFSTGLSRAEHLFFPAQVDGHALVAIVDTGAQMSALSATAARAMGVAEASLARDRALVTRDATAEELRSHLHQFSELRVGSEIIRDPELVVTAAQFRDADIILGADFLKSRRLWLAYETAQLFLSRP